MLLAIYLNYQVLFYLPKECQDLHYIGCVYQGEPYIYVKEGLDAYNTEFVISHEICHLAFKTENEAFCNEFAKIALRKP